MKKYKLLPLAILIPVLSQVRAQNLIDNYLSGTPSYSIIASQGDNISLPRDLDFKPNSNELWVALRGNFTGGSHVIIYNAGLANQTTEYRKDSHSDHFNHTTSGIAFSDIGEFATTGEYKMSNSTFMGPTLWPADTAIFARVFQSNWANGYPLGSHLDMLHQSPYAMGIAHDSAKAYWVFDGHNGNLCRYDYVSDHGPGYDNHSAGKIWRYTGITVTRVPNVPSHLVMDKANKWLYFIDGGSKTLKRLKTTSGSVIGNLTAPNEILSGYYNMGSTATVETIETFTGQPCGVEYFNDRLLVSDYATGGITIYNTSGTNPVNMGKIATGQPGIMGIKIGPDGRIWFVNYTQSTVVRIDVPGSANDAGILKIDNPLTENSREKFYSPFFNVCGTSITPVVTLINTGTNSLGSVTINYRIGNGAVSSHSWTGTLAPGATVAVTLPAIAAAAGRQELAVFTSSPNGSNDPNPANDMKKGSCRIVNTVGVQFLEDFSAATFPPPGWDLIGYNKYAYLSRNASVGAYGSNSGSLKMGNYTAEQEINANQVDYAMLPQIDLRTVAQASLEFSIAYAQYNAGMNDRLKLMVSADCGNSWSTVFDQAGATLSTAPPTTAPFVPQASEWKTEAISLDAYAGQNVMLMFTFVSASGNDVYLDDLILLSVPLAIEDTDQAAFALYPNPASDHLNIRTREPGTIVEVLIHDMLGRPASHTQNASTPLRLDVSALPEGVYMVTIRNNGNTSRRKIVID